MGFFLVAVLDDFIENARLMIFETFCRIHQCISINMLADKLNMTGEDAERWIVNRVTLLWQHRLCLLTSSSSKRPKCCRSVRKSWLLISRKNSMPVTPMLHSGVTTTFKESSPLTELFFFQLCLVQYKKN